MVLNGLGLGWGAAAPGWEHAYQLHRRIMTENDWTHGAGDAYRELWETHDPDASGASRALAALLGEPDDDLGVDIYGGSGRTPAECLALFARWLVGTLAQHQDTDTVEAWNSNNHSPQKKHPSSPTDAASRWKHSSTRLALY